ncbi:protein nessun dorma [Condylostylus longicornis]|uniref:protein nessun dorma n=1 Tax=Condylostylus longicornis TaxID=2530218 RepID=UPI00244DF75B|nr:protein nessun dorma [Condylostylus longicornis]
MDVFEFQKSLPTRFAEYMIVLSWSEKLVPASQVRDEWSYFLQLQIEPGGWQAIWKVPRVICESLKIPYPTFVMGTVDHVIFEELKAVFSIEAVEEDSVHIPETQEVKLEDLYVTIQQENTALNTEKTAEIIDNLRFFYKNIWMPWDHDDDDDLDWVKKHLESRLQFYYDLQKKIIKCSVANHIKSLLCEAKYLQEKRQCLEMNISDDDELEESVPKENVTDLLQLHLRLKLIKNEMDILENPHMRKVYEEIELKERGVNNDIRENSFSLMVIKPCTLENLKSFLETSKTCIENKSLIRICPNLQEALQISQTNDQILLDVGNHSVTKFITNLPDKGMLSGIFETEKTIINSLENERILFLIDGDFTLKNLTLYCGKVRTAIVIKNGNVNIIDCHIIGDENSSTKQGICVSGNSSLIVKRCFIENFAIGIRITEDASVNLHNTIINGCGKAIEIVHKNKLICENLKISNSKIAGIVCGTQNTSIKEKHVIITDFNKTLNSNILWNDECTFENNASNIVIYSDEFKNKQYIEDISTNGIHTPSMDKF